ncbi:rhomboid family intramembrane serine protease [Thermodesulfobacteriota bacterium]
MPPEVAVTVPQHILDGQYYRTATALMLHANGLHLAGNLLGIALFGTAVCSVTGWGVGGLMILMSGIAGNFVNAALYRTGHISIGASTAVFGAVGFLAAHQFFKKVSLPGQHIKAWLPLGGGLALLGLLGSGQHVDLTAHLFGFGSGIVFGLGYGLLIKHPASTRYQIASFLSVVSILTVAWRAAFGNG